MANQTYYGEAEIDIVDFLFFLLKKWKSALVLILICVILGGVYGVLQPIAEPTVYVPTESALVKMEEASQARKIYENALASGDVALVDINNGRALVEALEKSLTGDALTYYQVNYLGMPDPSAAEAPTVNIAKYLIIGAILGAVLWGIGCCVFYLMDGTVKTADELSASYGIILLGRIRAAQKGLIAAWHEKTKRPETTVGYLSTAIDGIDDENVTLCGNHADELIKSLTDSIVAASKKVTACEFVSESETALKQAKASGSVILVVHTWKTKRAQIQRELEMCRVQNVKVLGMIVID